MVLGEGDIGAVLGRIAYENLATLGGDNRGRELIPFLASLEDSPREQVGARENLERGKLERNYEEGAHERGAKQVRAARVLVDLFTCPGQEEPEGLEDKR